MDGVSSAFAVVSLAIRLVETGEKISKFLTNVQDAPSEVSKLGQTVDQLNSTLKQVKYLLEQQYLVLRLPGSPVFITNALENCEKRIKTLENVIWKHKTAMEHKNRLHKSWAAIKLVWRKEDIREMQSQFRDAEALLRTAMLSNSWQLQYVCQAEKVPIWVLLIVDRMHPIGISSSSDSQAMTLKQPPLAKPIQSVSQHETLQNPFFTYKATLRANSKEKNHVWYHGCFGRVDIHVKSTWFSTSKSRRTRDRAVSAEKTIKITPAFLRRTLELRLLSSFGQISRTLRTYPILDGGAPIFGLCLDGDLRGLQGALSSGTISPFVKNENGWSPLHVRLGNGSNHTISH